jgi:hypothetical protein
MALPWNPARAAWRRVALALLLAAVVPSGGRADILFGQTDAFQDGTTQSWTNGAPAPDPINVPNGGPAGAGDHYLQVTATGSGAGGRLTVFNRNQWHGNFLAAGVSAVEMDLKNFGTTPLEMRLALKAGVGAGAAGYATTTPFLLPVDGQWHHATFVLDAAHLTQLNSTTLTLPTLLSNVAEFRVLNSTSPALNGDFIVGQFGVDDVHATAAVPAPGGLVLLLTGGGLLAACARRRRPAGTGPSD